MRNNIPEPGANKIPAGPELIRRVLDKIPLICGLTREVFISPYDLYLLDRETGVLGGFCQGDSQVDPTIEIDDICFADSEEFIRDTFEFLNRPIPWIFTPSGAHYFLPSLAMDVPTLCGFMRLPYAEKVRVCALSKLCLVDGDRIPGFEHLDPEGLGPDVWRAMFDFDPALQSPKEADLKRMLIAGPIQKAMWMDRCLDRAGAARPLREIEGFPLRLKLLLHKYGSSYQRAYRLLSKRGGIHGLFRRVD